MSESLVCKHEQLKRQCELCEKDETIAQLQAKAIQLHDAVAVQGGLLCQKEAENARLRGGLQWYADGKHYIFDPDWEEEEGWLCPPSSDSFMVEPGRVAQAILNGQAINPDGDDDLITIDANKSGV